MLHPKKKIRDKELRRMKEIDINDMLNDGLQLLQLRY